MFSNKFNVGIVYVFKVQIIKFIFKNLLIRSNNVFFKKIIPIVGKFFVVYIFFEFTLFFAYFSNNICQIKKIRNKKNMLVGGKGGVMPTMVTQNFTKLNCVSFISFKIIFSFVGFE
jgi:hypothetical protein